MLLSGIVYSLKIDHHQSKNLHSGYGCGCANAIKSFGDMLVERQYKLLLLFRLNHVYHTIADCEDFRIVQFPQPVDETKDFALISRNLIDLYQDTFKI